MTQVSTQLHAQAMAESVWAGDIYLDEGSNSYEFMRGGEIKGIGDAFYHAFKSYYRHEIIWAPCGNGFKVEFRDVCNLSPFALYRYSTVIFKPKHTHIVGVYLGETTPVRGWTKTLAGLFIGVLNLRYTGDETTNHNFIPNPKLVS
jgi:hypothetical protein